MLGLLAASIPFRISSPPQLASQREIAYIEFGFINTYVLNLGKILLLIISCYSYCSIVTVTELFFAVSFVIFITFIVLGSNSLRANVNSIVYLK